MRRGQDAAGRRCARQTRRLYDDIVNAFSMRNYLPVAVAALRARPVLRDVRPYGERDLAHPGEMIAALLRRYAADAGAAHRADDHAATPPSHVPAVCSPRSRASSDPAARLALLKDYIRRAVPKRDTADRRLASATSTTSSAATAQRPIPAATSATATSRRSIATADEARVRADRVRGRAGARGPARRRAQLRRAGGLSRRAHGLSRATWR